MLRRRKIDKAGIMKRAHKAAKLMRASMIYSEKFAIALQKEWQKMKEFNLGVLGMVKIQSNTELERETEKAVLVRGVWFPKSYTKVCQLGVYVADWLFDENKFKLI